MPSWILVAIGGALGALARFGVYRLMPAQPGRFPLATLIANSIGCFLIGLLMGWISRGSANTQSFYLLAGMGFLGAFTTFSTFGWETLQLLQAGQTGTAALNVGAQCVLGIAAVWLGSLLLRA